MILSSRLSMFAWWAALCLLLVLSFGPVACDALPGGPVATPTQTQFAVEAGQKYTVAVTLREGHSVSGTVSVSGAQNYIDFYIKGPNGELAYGVVRVQGGQSFEMEADKDGTYAMTFDNAFSFGSSRQVTLSYQVR